LEDRIDIDITFNSIEELKEKLDLEISEITNWFYGGKYDESRERLKIVRMAKGGKIEVGSIVNLPEIKMKDGRVQFERVVDGEVIGFEDGVYDVLNPKTNRIHRVAKNQIEKPSAYSKHRQTASRMRNDEDTYPKGTEFAKGGEVGQKVFEAKEDGILGIFSGSDAYSIQISKGDTFVTYGDQDDSNWWYVKKIDKKPSTMSLNNDFDYTKSKSRVKVNWDELILTFPKGDNTIYAKMVEIHAKGGTTKRIKRRSC
jgi:hypothetical protein